MAQANSMQREPSMEEILASIRRIIEDSDTSRKAMETSGRPTDTAAEITDVHAFRAGLREEANDEPAGLPIGHPNAEERDTAEVRPAAAPLGIIQRPPAEARSDSDEIEMELNLDDFSEGDADEEAHLASSTEDGAEMRPAIMSEHVGRQVAASFGELSAAFEARSRKSFDQIAEDMMRPMLQDWLDNNLPHLVERLVREEIERIARGAAATR